MNGRVDAHHHVWDLAVRDQPWTVGRPALRRSFGLDELRPLLADRGIAATIVVQTVASAEETPELLALAAAEPIVAGVVGWVDLTAPDVADRLAVLRAHPGGAALVGVRHQVQAEPDARWLARSDVQRGLAAVASAGLVYDLLVTAEQLPAALDTVRAQPQLRFVLDHGGNPPAGPGAAAWLHNVERLGELPNVAVKLSGLVTRTYPATVPAGQLDAWADTLLTAFGPRRVMFGSDWPVCTLAASYREVVEAAERMTGALSADERAEVFGATAARVYGLAR